jgi:dihydrofolate reductase
MWNLQSLDGCFNGAHPWDLGALQEVWGEELERYVVEQCREVGTLLFGRVTYEGMAAHWTKATGAIADFMNGIDKVVISRTMEAADWNNTRLEQGNAVAVTNALKREDGKDVFVFGSAQLSDALVQAGLFDEYRICIAPLVLGDGEPLFKPGGERRRLKLAASRVLSNGAVILRYLPSLPVPEDH